MPLIAFLPTAAEDPPPPPPRELTPAEHAAAAWPWLRQQCAPSTWTRFTHSISVRQPQAKGWPQA